MADHFLGLGHRWMGYIAGNEGASTQRDREAGFLEGLAQAGFSLRRREVGDFSYDEAREATRRMFAKPSRPTAVFVCNDHMAFAVMDVLRFELKLSVPGDVSVAGFDDVPPARWPAYDLTTVRQNLPAMVAETVATLMDTIKSGGEEPRRVVLESELILRGSTGPNKISPSPPGPKDD